MARVQLNRSYADNSLLEIVTIERYMFDFVIKRNISIIIMEKRLISLFFIAFSAFISVDCHDTGVWKFDFQFILKDYKC